MVSFQAKIGWKSQKKRENKNYRCVSFLLDAKQKIPKKKQKLKKIKKYNYTIVSSQNRIEKTEKGKKKLTFCFVPARREIENSKKIAKNSKTLKIP